MQIIDIIGFLCSGIYEYGPENSKKNRENRCVITNMKRRRIRMMESLGMAAGCEEHYFLDIWKAKSSSYQRLMYILSLLFIILLRHLSMSYFSHLHDNSIKHNCVLSPKMAPKDAPDDARATPTESRACTPVCVVCVVSFYSSGKFLNIGILYSSNHVRYK